jgi:L-methionine (R)-S-oxide reductase
MESTLSLLLQLSTLPGRGANLEENLKQCVVMTAQILNVSNSVIMLLGDGEQGEKKVAMLKAFSVGAEHAVAVSAAQLGQDDSVFGPILSAGGPRLIEDLSDAEFLSLQHHVPDAFKCLVAAPIHINDKVVGIISASGHKLNRPLEQRDLELIGIIGLLIGKSMQVVQLQNVLSSRFAQLALVREAKANLGVALEKAVENPDQLARILAKSFFREMTRTGFSTSQIINASAEIITQLSSSLNRHSKRLEKSKG